MTNWFPIPRTAESATVIQRSRFVALLKEEEIASHAKKLALELECLLLSCENNAKYWESANKALSDYQADIDRLYPQEHVSPLGKD